MAQIPFKVPSFLSLNGDNYADTIDADLHVAATKVPAERISLDQYWYEAWNAVGARGDGHGMLEQLLAAYAEPHRQVRGRDHLLHCLSTLNRWREETRFFYVLAMGLWYHDICFDPNRHDNEARSARVAMSHLTAAGVAPDLSKAVRDLVIATRPGEVPQGAESRLINDIDRSILGADEQRFNRYERGLRAEHNSVSDFVYRRRRIEQLQSLLGKTRIYASFSAHDELEAPARANLARWLQIWQETTQLPAAHEGGMPSANELPTHVV